MGGGGVCVKSKANCVGNKQIDKAAAKRKRKKKKKQRTQAERDSNNQSQCVSHGVSCPLSVLQCSSPPSTPSLSVRPSSAPLSVVLPYCPFPPCATLPLSSTGPKHSSSPARIVYIINSPLFEAG